MPGRVFSIAVMAVTAAALTVGAARGATIIDDWYAAKLPTPPQLKAGDAGAERDRASGYGFHGADLHCRSP